MAKTKNLVGWVLLFLGLSLIGGGLFYSFNFFTGRQEPPQVFRSSQGEGTPKLSESLNEPSSQTPQEQAEDLMREQAGEMMGEQLEEMLPTNVISRSLNLFSWSIFMGILIFAGAQISGIGVKMIKG